MHLWIHVMPSITVRGHRRLPRMEKVVCVLVVYIEDQTYTHMHSISPHTPAPSTRVTLRPLMFGFLT